MGVLAHPARVVLSFSYEVKVHATGPREARLERIRLGRFQKGPTGLFLFGYLSVRFLFLFGSARRGKGQVNGPSVMPRHLCQQAFRPPLHSYPARRNETGSRQDGRQQHKDP
jgi:hypothetical protein